MIAFGIFLFVMLVVFHEYGHFIAAKRNGVVPEEFGIGFPPKLFGHKPKGSDTEYTINLLPLGGFVRLRGESDSARGKGSFGAASLKAKTKIILAGVGMNVIATFVLFLLLALTSLPRILPDQFSIAGDETAASEQLLVTGVADESPAQKLGIEPTDELVAINSTTFETTVQLQEFTQEHAGEEVYVIWNNDQGEQRGYAVLSPPDSEEGFLGISTERFETVRYTWSAPLVALGLTLQTIWLTLSGIFELIAGLVSGGGSEAAEGIAGPIGVFFILQNVSELGLSYLLFLMATISASLTALNALPIPALDGGRLALILLFRGLKKPLTEKIEQAINGAGFALLMIAIIAISIYDFERFF